MYRLHYKRWSFWIAIYTLKPVWWCGCFSPTEIRIVCPVLSHLVCLQQRMHIHILYHMYSGQFTDFTFWLSPDLTSMVSTSSLLPRPWLRAQMSSETLVYLDRVGLLKETDKKACQSDWLTVLQAVRLGKRRECIVCSVADKPWGQILTKYSNNGILRTTDSSVFHQQKFSWDPAYGWQIYFKPRLNSLAYGPILPIICCCCCCYGFLGRPSLKNRVQCGLQQILLSK